MKIGHHCDLEPGVLRMPRPDWDYLMHDCQAGWFPPKCPESQKEKNRDRDAERLLGFYRVNSEWRKVDAHTRFISSALRQLGAARRNRRHQNDSEAKLVAAFLRITASAASTC